MPEITQGPGQGPNKYTETTRKSYGKRIMDSIKGIFIGIIIFVISFGLLFWNEGRVNLANIARQAQPAAADTVDASLDSTFVAASGKLSAEKLLGDAKYLQPGTYVSVKRKVDVYAWVEKASSESNVKTGGSEETTTTYTYEKQWVNKPANSNNFKITEGHTNAAKTLPNATYSSSDLTVGAYALDSSKLTFPDATSLELKPELLQLESDMIVANDEYVYKGNATYAAPQVGDLRIAYDVVDSGIDATVFGQIDGEKISQYTDEKTGKILYRAFESDKSGAIQILQKEYKRMMWIFRAVGFLLMWIGLSMLFGPISTLLDVLPIFGSISRSAIKFVTFIVSLVLTILTILLSILLHNIYAVIVIIVLIVGGAIWWLKKKA